MTILGIASSGAGAIVGQQQRAQQRDDTKENTSRWAINHFQYVTTGAGSLVDGVVSFDCQYIEEPVFTTGAVLTQPPDISRYHLPLGQAMVYGWITQPQEAGAATAAAGGTDYKQYWIGAYLAFEVQIKGLENATASDLLANPAYATLTHHLCFNGLAMKKLPTDVTASQDDPTVPSRDLGFTLLGA